MDNQKQSFLNAILGEIGAGALVKAADRSPALEYALVPRAILGWVCSAPRYEGEIPGIEGTSISFEKSEDGFVGSVDIGDKLYKFEDATVFYVAASIGIALGINQDEAPEGLRDFDIQALGKSLDILIKVKRVGAELAKAEKGCPECGGVGSHPTTCQTALKNPKVITAHDRARSADHEEMVERSQKALKNPKVITAHDRARSADHEEMVERSQKAINKDELAKAKEPGGNAAAPMAPTAPVAPTAVAPQQPKSTPAKLPKLPGSAGAKPPKPVTAAKPVGVKMTRSEVEHNCPSCGLKQFNGKQFTGCMCFKALSKGVKVLGSNPTGTLLEFNMSVWDRQGVLTLLESVGRKV